MRRILIVEDHPLVSATLTMFLSQFFPDRETVVASTLLEAFAHLAEDHDPALIVLDLELPDATGLQALEAIIEIGRELPILVFTSHVDPALAEQCLRLGARRFLSKLGTCAEVIACATQILTTASDSSESITFQNGPEASTGQGSTPVRPSLASRDVSRPIVSYGAAHQKLRKLTDRQREVLELLAEGLPTKRISDRLNICDGTVKLHLTQIYKLLEVRNRTEAALLLRQSAHGALASASY